MERHKRIVAMALVTALLLTACSEGDGAAEGIEPIEEPQPDPVEPEPDPVDGDPEPEVEVDPDPEAEPTTIDITVVPDEITEEYVEAVFVELEQLYAEALAEMRENGDEINLEVMDRLGEIFDNEATLPTNLRVFQDAASDGFPNVREARDIGPRVRTVTSLLSARGSCVYAETVVDAAMLLVEPSDAQINYVELLPKTIERPNLFNATPWVYGRVLVPTSDSDLLEFMENDPCSS